MDPIENQQEEHSPLSHYRETTKANGQKVYVPVIDVRDGMAERALAEQVEKAANHSKYITYNQYHISPKRKN